MEMVQYWKHKESVQAKVTELDGVTVMYMEGEKYAFPGFPRGHLLFGSLSKLKHEVKNQIFNESWALLEEGGSSKEVIQHIKSKALPNVFKILEANRYDLVPEKKMVISVRELHRAWTKVSPGTHELRDLICYVLQEDDGYRFRFQWLAGYMPTWLFRFVSPTKALDKAFQWIEVAEVINDMKERQVLLRRIIMTILDDPHYRKQLDRLFREIDWKKIRMSKADKYFFRGKYFKVDLDLFEY